MGKEIDILREENSKIKKELTELRESVQYHSDSVDEVNKKLEDIDNRVEEMKLDEMTEDFVTKTKTIYVWMSFKKKPMKRGRKVKE